MPEPTPPRTDYLKEMNVASSQHAEASHALDSAHNAAMLDLAKKHGDQKWEDAMHAARSEHAPDPRPEPTKPDKPPVITIPEPATRPTMDQLIADGQVIHGTHYMQPDDTLENKVVIARPDEWRAIDIPTKPGIYGLFNVFASGGKAEAVGTPAGTGINADGSRNRKVIIKGGGAVDVPYGEDGKASGYFLKECDIDVRQAVCKNIAYRGENKTHHDLSHGMYLKDCDGTVIDLLGDRVAMSLLKRSSTGPGRSRVDARRLFATRCGMITSLSTSSRDVRFPPDGWHVNSPTLYCGGEQLGRWAWDERLGKAVWDVWAGFFRGGNKTCPVNGMWIGPTETHGSTRSVTSDADAEPVNNIHDDGWGNLDAPSLLPGGMTVVQWGEAIRDGWRRDMVPAVIRGVE